MEVSWRTEGLSDNSRSYNFSVRLNQLSISLVGEKNLRKAGNDQRIDNPEKHGSRYCHQYGNNQISPHHNSPLGQPNPSDQHINQLDTQERDNDSAHTIDPEIAAEKRCCAHRAVFHAAQRQRNQGNNNYRVEDHRG